MGFNIAWVAVRGIPYGEALERLALVDTGAEPGYPEHDFNAQEIVDGWTLVTASGCDSRIIDKRALATLSGGCEAIACSVEEHVMFSSAERWVEGKLEWRVAHDAQISLDHLASAGKLPAIFDEIAAGTAMAQEAEGGADADVDLFFDVPLLLAASMVAYKHDAINPDIADEGFHVLADAPGPAGASGRAWWQLWK